MTTSELKEYIFEKEKIPFILESVGCHNIKYHPTKKSISCANPDGDNTGAVVIFNDKYLNCVNYTRNIEKKSDIITLIGFYRNTDFKQTVRYLYKILDLKMTYNPIKKVEEKRDPLHVFKKVAKYRNRYSEVSFEVLNEDILNDFSPYIHMDWFREGVMPWTTEKFGLGYSDKHKRVIIPHRYWLDGQLLGIMGRSTIENCELLGVKKYMPVWAGDRALSYEKGINLYGLWENYDSIIKAGYIVIFEGEKSVLKRHSLNDGTGAALCCHSITDEQIKILIGLNVEIIFALDKDVPIEEVKAMCDHFYGIRKVSYIYDRKEWSLLGEKDSPADAQNEVYNFMFKYRNIYEG